MRANGKANSRKFNSQGGRRNTHLRTGLSLPGARLRASQLAGTKGADGARADKFFQRQAEQLVRAGGDNVPVWARLVAGMKK